jgi:hypothetical protein
MITVYATNKVMYLVKNIPIIVSTAITNYIVASKTRHHGVVENIAIINLICAFRALKRDCLYVLQEFNHNFIL